MRCRILLTWALPASLLLFQLVFEIGVAVPTLSSYVSREAPYAVHFGDADTSADHARRPEGFVENAKAVDKDLDGRENFLKGAHDNGGGHRNDDDDDDDDDHRGGGAEGGGIDNANALGAGAGDGDDECFPGVGTVELESGSIKQMSQLTVGDRVRVSPTEFSEVFMFTHRMDNVHKVFVKIRTGDGKQIVLTPGHYLYVNEKLAPARTATAGDFVQLGNGKMAPVVHVTRGYEKGLYNPQTIHGDIVVNGIIASTYTTAVQYDFAHAVLAPLRAMFSTLGVSLSAFEQGAHCLATVVPKGR